MPHPYPTQIFQEEIKNKFALIYPPAQYPNATIKKEWRSIENVAEVYSPRVDVAVGPFSDIRGGSCSDHYDTMMDDKRNFIETLLNFHFTNIERFRVPDEFRHETLVSPTFISVKNFNSNARCLFAVEIENNVSRKHLLGGAVNASVLGRLGIIVGWTDEKVKALVKLQAYWDYLNFVGKNSFETKNLIILSPDQLREALEITDS